MLFVISGLLLIALMGEIYLRLANPFMRDSVSFHFVDGVGVIREPNVEMRHANLDDGNFVVSRANQLGFLDREPISPELAAEGCHIAFIGDSYVEARQVPIADKFHVRMEEMAARHLPHLAITTQAYGIGGTGQINQIPFYDEYARRLNPKLLVAVFFINDFFNNSPGLQALYYGLDPDRMPHLSSQRDEHGDLTLRPPDSQYMRFRLPRPQVRQYQLTWRRLTGASYFATLLDMKGLNLGGRPAGPDSEIALRAAWANIITQHPCCTALLDGWQLKTASHTELTRPFSEEHLPTVFQEALEYTAFGIERLKRRADRDGAKMAILAATQDMGTRGDPQFDRLYAIAEPLDIPIISQYDYMVSQGHNPQYEQWRSDGHWSATGHQWVAEAILEWLKANQDVCN